jgi:hypothetical protein
MGEARAERGRASYGVGKVSGLMSSVSRKFAGSSYNGCSGAMAETPRRFPPPWHVDPAEAQQAKMRSEDQGTLGGGAGSKKCATTTAAMTARMANPIAS